MAQSRTPKPRICIFLDRAVLLIGKAVGWLTLPLVFIIILQIFLRYGLHRGMTTLEELQWHLYAVMFMIALSYSLVNDAHIRLDLLHQNFSARTKQWIEVLGIVCLLMPMIAVVFYHGIPLATKSFKIMERSAAPTGLPFRFIIKSFLPIGVGLLGLAAFSRLINGISILFGRHSTNGD